MHLNVAHNTAAFYSLLTIIDLDWMSIRLVMEFLVLTFYFLMVDQCAAMAKALRNIMPMTRHRWCRWHVLKKAKKKLGRVYSKQKPFKRTDVVAIDEFESGWEQIISKYVLE